MFWRRNRKISDWNGLFHGYFIDARALYALEFDDVSCISFIGEIDTTAAYAFINEHMQGQVVRTYQHSYFEHQKKEMYFNNTILIVTQKRMIELGNNYCQLLHTPGQYGWANELISELAKFRMVVNEPSIGFVRQAAAN